VRYAVVETRIYEVEAPDEDAAVDQLEAEPDREPIYRTTVVELLARRAPRASRPTLQVCTAAATPGPRALS
jgi:hypothetical protein